VTCFLVLDAIAFGQAKQRSLTVNGQSGSADAIDAGGRTFVDVAGLASIAKGSVSFSGSQIVLTLPAAGGAAGTPASTEPPPAATPAKNSNELSHEFMKAGIEEIARLREWATTLATAIQGNYGVTDEWVSGYRDQAAQAQQLADAAATTDGDRKASAELRSAFALVQQWSDKLVSEKKNMDTAKYTNAPGALRQDPLSQKIIGCGHFLSQMLGGGMYQEGGACR
jgi:hypothetical protein